MYKTFLYAVLCTCTCFISFAGVAQANSSAEEDVRAFFADIPVMIEIARCESKFRQFNTDGTPLRGGWGGGMVGVFQFYDAIHRGAASGLGYDIDTLEGNLGYAKHIYARSGTTPWNSARTCWQQASVQNPAPASDAEIAELQNRIATLKVLLAQLQELLAQKKAV